MKLIIFESNPSWMVYLAMMLSLIHNTPCAPVPIHRLPALSSMMHVGATSPAILTFLKVSPTFFERPLISPPTHNVFFESTYKALMLLLGNPSIVLRSVMVFSLELYHNKPSRVPT